ncbi:response regulator [Actinomadura rupiterrae]|uniref:response regulator n=1 Tax=Actinomadura rupiterrae TaxID=559627 RepID=UPI0020A51987|nr:response regulator [Actinomadura rupiterrae]MCP2335074.1 CheY-like chemotaxis protein [Actinomadura rupiterrae]
MTDVTRVLAVDDRADNLVALRAVLDALPVEVVCADSGRAALRALLGAEFGLILMDLVMPGMDGLETARHIRSRPRTRHVPIIFLTACGDGGLAPAAYAVGAADLLTKPFDPWLLRAKASAFIELDRHQRELRRQAALLRDAATAPPRVPAPTPAPSLAARPESVPADAPAPDAARLRMVDARLREVESLTDALPESLDPAVPPLCAQVRALRQALDPLLSEDVARQG